MLGSGIAFLDGTIMNVALPTIGAGLDTDGRVAVDPGRLPAHARVPDPARRLARRPVRPSAGVPRRPRLVRGCVPAVRRCADTDALVAARALQGIGGGVAHAGQPRHPSGHVRIRTTAPEPSVRGRGSAASSAPSARFSAGGSSGVGSWRLIFLINVPLAVATVAVTLRYVPETRDRQSVGGIDAAGAALTAVGLAGVSWALIESGERGATGATLIAGAIGVAALAGFVVVERRGRPACCRSRSGSSRQFTAANLVTFVVYASLGITFFLLSVDLQQVLGYSPIRRGCATLPVTVIMLVLSARAGMLAERVGPRLPMTVGPLGVAAGLVLLSRVYRAPTYLRHGAAR